MLRRRRPGRGKTVHSELRDLQVGAMVLVFALLFAGRLVKGWPRRTSAGLEFPLKPVVVFSRAVALPLYALLFAYPLWISQRSIPPWLSILLFVAVVFGLYQYPGTIVLTDGAVVQRFWLRAEKRVVYADVLNVLALGGGAVTRVFGQNGVLITHTFNHAGSAEFRRELEQRTGKPVVR